MLFDGNYGFNMNYMNMDNSVKNEVNILNPYESFIRGNSFKDEYIPYKKYSYLELKPTNNKEKLLFNIMSLNFIINDLNLYLDLNADDKEMFNLFKKYVKEEQELIDQYKKEYGPLTLEDTIGNNYNWNTDFSWDNKRGDIYV